MRMSYPIRAAFGALMCGVFAAACSESPAGPLLTAQPLAADTVAASAGLSLEDIEARGWDCRPAPMIPNRKSCSPPNQPHPVTLPDAIDPMATEGRPPTFSLLIFDNGVFFGTDLLIRANLYRGQPCKFTGGNYRFIPRIAYYECLHPKAG